MRVGLSVVSVMCSASIAAAGVFQNLTTIELPSVGAANPYPSTINVSGLASVTTSVRVRLNGLYHGRPDDMDILLVGPTGVAAMLMSDAGDTIQISNVIVTFADGAPSLPDNGPLVAGTFAPTDFEPGDAFPAPAPAGPYGTSLAAFNGLDSNGVWRLFIVDDLDGKSGRLGLGWELEITAVPAPGVGALAGLMLLAGARRRRR